MYILKEIPFSLKAVLIVGLLIAVLYPDVSEAQTRKSYHYDQQSTQKSYQHNQAGRNNYNRSYGNNRVMVGMTECKQVSILGGFISSRLCGGARLVTNSQPRQQWCRQDCPYRRTVGIAGTAGIESQNGILGNNRFRSRRRW